MREPTGHSPLPGLLFALLRLLLAVLAMVAPLVALGVQALGQGALAIGVFALGYSGLFLLCVCCPGLPGLRHLSRHVGLPLRPGESLPHYNRRIGLLLMVVGAVLVSACIFGLPWLYAHGLKRGDAPLTEVILMIPCPLLGVTLGLWGVGKFLKGL